MLALQGVDLIIYFRFHELILRFDREMNQYPKFFLIKQIPLFNKELVI